MKLVFLPALMLFVNGCGVKSDDNDASAPDLDGSWETACFVASGSGATTVFAKATMIITGSAQTETIASFSDAGCAAEVGLHLDSAQTFTIGDSVAAPAGAKAIDIVMTKATMIPMDDAIATKFNTASTCAFKDWVKGTAKDVTSCKRANGKAMFGSYYGVVKTDGVTWTDGDSDETNDGSTPEKRPTALASGHFTKK